MAMDISAHCCAFGSGSQLLWRVVMPKPAQTRLKGDGKEMIAALITHLPLAHVLPAQDEGDTHSLALLYSSPMFQQCSTSRTFTAILDPPA